MLFRVTSAVMGVAAALMFAAFMLMLGFTLVQVVNRYAIGLTLFWTEELVVLLLVWSVLLGLPVQLWQHNEIVVDVLPLRREQAAKLKRLAATGCSIAFCLVLLVTGIDFTVRGGRVSSPALGLPRLWFFLPIPLSAGLSILALVVRRRADPSGAYE